MTKEAKIKLGLGIVVVVALLTVVLTSSNSTLFQGRMTLSQKLIKNHYFEYFKGQDSHPFYYVETAESNLGGKMEVLDEKNKLVKEICTLTPGGVGSGCSWDGLKASGEELVKGTAKYKFKASVYGPAGSTAVVESPLFLFDTTGI